MAILGQGGPRARRPAALFPPTLSPWERWPERRAVPPSPIGGRGDRDSPDLREKQKGVQHGASVKFVGVRLPKSVIHVALFTDRQRHGPQESSASNSSLKVEWATQNEHGRLTKCPKCGAWANWSAHGLSSHTRP